ncbi:hypothetical protein ACFFRR_003243 [Megaselia abdita]
MASSKNKSSSSGLRILWIPGRKRHNNKGYYDATKKDVDYSRKQKKSEPWSLGGSKSQHDFLKADPSDLDAGPSNLITTTCVVGGIEVANKVGELCSDERDLKIENMETLTVTLENHEKDKNDDSGTGSGNFELSPRRKPDVEHPTQPLTPSTVKSDDESQPNDDEVTTGAASSASTMPLASVRKQNGNGKPSSQSNNSKKSSDFDSIEILDNKPKLSSTDLDSIDGSLYNYSTSSEKRLRKKKIDDDENADDKCVTCLYYTCLCCDCTIS